MGETLKVLVPATLAYTVPKQQRPCSRQGKRLVPMCIDVCTHSEVRKGGGEDRERERESERQRQRE